MSGCDAARTTGCDGPGGEPSQEAVRARAAAIAARSRFRGAYCDGAMPALPVGGMRRRRRERVRLAERGGERESVCVCVGLFRLCF